ncbi:hypothetical protein PC129_g17126 [Phytophthora cactorum]|uniref:Uncharacterized protein n=1 Tax=Phytophthora cactorum TaxID=29920 RepID=A0A8T1HH64_9STRA|nr:hypothetical protein Pcac1_g13494 [Phytophthora cactorum]KAG3146578.1 hypothetical protein PI126_g13262 [Phytophthora idaei]KAG2804907.1 hypothetical protein PC112_g18505 [Phytophthora cactorum]KAG2858796.1 hypothetical protein PC113_g9497 [Phytophthora cactorum]KAG2909365.1 hypothetical protein PC117_g19690 [Phytophthora cactorum]
MAEWSLTGSSKADPSSMVETFLENLSMSALSVLSYRLEWEHQGLDFQSLVRRLQVLRLPLREWLAP